MWALKAPSKAELDKEWRFITKYFFKGMFPSVDCELLISTSPDLMGSCYLLQTEECWLKEIKNILKNEVYQMSPEEMKLSIKSTHSRFRANPLRSKSCSIAREPDGIGSVILSLYLCYWC